MRQGFQTGTVPQSWVNPYGQGIAGLGAQQLGRPIDIGALTPQVAGPGAFSQAQQQLAADVGGLGSIQRDAAGQISGFTGGTGVASFQPYLQTIQDKQLLDPTQYADYMSPYQQDVIDKTLTEFDKQAAIGANRLGTEAVTAGAFGGARHGVAESEYQTQSDLNRAGIQASMLEKAMGVGQAGQAAHLANLKAQAQFVPSLQGGLGQMLGQMGGMENQYSQALQNQLAASNQMALNLPMSRIQQGANIFGATAGKVPGAPVEPFAGNPYLQGISTFGGLQKMMGAQPRGQNGNGGIASFWAGQ